MRYVLQRILQALVLVFIVASAVFFMLRLVPGDPVELLLSESAPSPQVVARLHHELGLDQTLPQQYLGYMQRLAHADLGTSFVDGHPVADDLWLRLPRTVELVLAAALLSLLIGLPLGTLAALRGDGWLDRTLNLLAGLNLSIPIFVIGTLLVLVFAQTLHWVPSGGFVAFSEKGPRHLLYLLMPAVALAIPLSASLFLMTRTAVLEAMSQDWVRTARAKGVSASRVVLHHIVRNALSPVVTVLGLHMGSLLGGAVVVEYVFNWPGLSSLLLSSVLARDYPEVSGIVLVMSGVFILLNLVTDLTVGVIDPRARSEA